MSDFTFVRATKTGCKARIGIDGGPGSGKTWTALTIAQGLDLDGRRIKVLDTDRRSAAKYADVFDFDVLTQNKFDPEDLTRIVVAATEQNAGCLIVDTMSPYWTGTDGMLDKVGQAERSFEGWKRMRPVERAMMDALLGAPFHVICTLRTKVEYVVQPNERGRMEPKRVGLKPEQRDGIEYEFDVMLSVADAGTSARITKSRCPELADFAADRPGPEIGQQIQAWLDRDAVGGMLNPFAVRDWALEDGRTIAELETKLAELEAIGQDGAAVTDRKGNLSSISDLLTRVITYLRRAQQQQAAAARRQEAAANGSAQPVSAGA